MRIENVISILVGACVGFLGCAFVGGSINPMDWGGHEVGRAIAALAICVFGWIGWFIFDYLEGRE